MQIKRHLQFRLLVALNKKINLKNQIKRKINLLIQNKKKKRMIEKNIKFKVSFLNVKQ